MERRRKRPPEIPFPPGQAVSHNDNIHYRLLDSNEELSDDTSFHSTFSYKPPPINIVGLNYYQVQHFTNSLKLFEGQFQLKLTPSGVKVFPASIDAFKALKFRLQNFCVEFFTHQLREEQTTKFVLHGLYEMTEIDLLNLLQEQNIQPIKVKAMKIKNKKYPDHNVYLIYFKKLDKINISYLHDKVKTVNNIRVLWEYYENPRKGPMQCSNCMSYGHGNDNCYMQPKCKLCAETHLSKDCPKLIDEATNQRRIPYDMLKCALCGENHAAKFSGCPKKIEFEQLRFKNLIQRQYQVNNQFWRAPQMDMLNFYRLATVNNGNPTISVIPNRDFFSADQLMQIFQELMIVMGRATSRTQQIMALGHIAIKYS